MFLEPTKYYPKKPFQCSNETPEPSTILCKYNLFITSKQAARQNTLPREREIEGHVRVSYLFVLGTILSCRTC